MMGGKPVKGTRQVNAELPPELLDRLKEFAESRGQTVRHVIERAIVRHLDNPPPIIFDPPLPPCEPDRVTPAKKPTRRPKRGKPA
jgi:hypothetical protein